jgi:spermidine synthase
MSDCYKDSRVEVFIGDGFKFLPEKKNTYDVIITDSSDPVGPAEALFKAPYFQLLKEALREGGNISTQAECIWNHLPLIKELKETCNKTFAVADYAFTTIPTCKPRVASHLPC